jgi:phosphatidylserine/phosphatidylglycerophosphate/cardiolipin synthase-like enzyme
MIDHLLDLPPHQRTRLLAALETGQLTPPFTPAALRAALGPCQNPHHLIDALTTLTQMGMPAPACAAWIRTLAERDIRRPKPDLVWSGPEAPGLYSRNTRQVYEQLLSSAQHTLWASTYAFFDGPKAFETLATHMDQTPALRVTLLLNIQRKKGDTTTPDALIRRFADRFWKTDWPGTARPRVFFDPRALDPEGPTGVLHAKAIVADDESLFLTSANLTEAALDRNIELGLLLRDRALATTVLRHFQTLIDLRLLHPLPMA